MSIIIRLQNLPWSANSLDIRRFFSGLSIPEGGVHIVGGEMGDAFIAFSTDEDARLAMAKDGGKIKDMQIKLLLSSRTEMMRVIEQARQQNVVVTQPHMIAPQPPILSLQQPPRVIPSAPEPDRRRGRTPSPHHRSRDRSPVRDRRRSPDDRRGSKRDRSRSPSRSSRGSGRDMDRRSDRFKRDDKRYDDSRYRDDRRSARDPPEESKRYSDADHVNSRSQLHSTDGFRDVQPAYDPIQNVSVAGMYHQYGSQQPHSAMKGFADIYSRSSSDSPAQLSQTEHMIPQKPVEVVPMVSQKHSISSGMYPLEQVPFRSLPFGSSIVTTKESSALDPAQQQMQKPRRRTRFEPEFEPPSNVPPFIAPRVDSKVPKVESQVNSSAYNLERPREDYSESRPVWPQGMADRSETGSWTEKRQPLLNPPVSKNVDFLQVVPMDLDPSPSETPDNEPYQTASLRDSFPYVQNASPVIDDFRRDNQNRGLPLRNDDLRRDNQNRGPPLRTDDFRTDQIRRLPPQNDDFRDNQVRGPPRNEDFRDNQTRGLPPPRNEDFRDSQIRGPPLQSDDLRGNPVRGLPSRNDDPRAAQIRGPLSRNDDPRGAQIRGPPSRNDDLRDNQIRGLPSRNDDPRVTQIRGPPRNDDLRDNQIRGPPSRNDDLRDIQIRGPQPINDDLRRDIPNRGLPPINDDLRRDIPNRGLLPLNDDLRRDISNRGPPPINDDLRRDILNRGPPSINDDLRRDIPSRGPPPRNDDLRRDILNRGPPPINDDFRRDIPNRGPPPINDDLRREILNRGPPPINDDLRRDIPNRGTPPINDDLRRDVPNRGPPPVNDDLRRDILNRGPPTRNDDLRDISSRGPPPTNDDLRRDIPNRGPPSRNDDLRDIPNRGPPPRNDDLRDISNRGPPPRNDDLRDIQNRGPPRNDDLDIQNRGPPLRDDGPTDSQNTGPLRNDDFRGNQNRGPLSRNDDFRDNQTRGVPSRNEDLKDDQSRGELPRDNDFRSGNQNRRPPPPNDELKRDDLNRGPQIDKDNQGKVPSSLTIEVRGLPLDARIDDILDIFHGISLPAANIRIEASDRGFEKAFIRFASAAEFEEAFNRNRRFMQEGRCELVPCPGAAFDNAPRPQKPKPKPKPREEDLTVQMRGLPFSCKDEDIVKFFDGLAILDLHIEMNPDGRASGVGFVEFGSPKDFRAALAMNGKMISHRYITVSVACKEMMALARGEDSIPKDSRPNDVPAPQPPINQSRSVSSPNKPLISQGRKPPSCIFMNGLPEGVTNRDIADFLGQVNVMPRAIHIMLRPDKMPSGDAYAEFATHADMEAALETSGKVMAGNRILVQPISFFEMSEILGRPTHVPPPSGPGALLRTPGDMDRPRRPLLPQGPGNPPYRERAPTVRGGRPFSDPHRNNMEGPPGRPPFGASRMRGPWPSRPFKQEGRFPPPAVDRGPKDFGSPGSVVAMNNLHFRAGLEDILEFFHGYHITKDNVIRKYNENGQTTGEARVAFQNPRDAQRVVRELNQKPIMGRPLSLFVV